MDRYFTNLTIKMVDEDQRIVEGWATTNSQDRAGDVVEPSGAEFDLHKRSIPFLLDHDATEAVGEVEAAEVTSTGIRFRARIKKIAEPGLAKDLVDRAWHLLKAGLRKSTSIGFRPLEQEPLPNGGWRFLRWEWLELSACAVPCNPEAQITGLKRAPRGDRSARLTPAKMKFVPAATRRKRRGGTIVDEKRYLRRARTALVHYLGEKKVPRFQTLAALEKWDDARQLDAIARGATCLFYETMMAAAPRPKALSVVRLRAR